MRRRGEMPLWRRALKAFRALAALAAAALVMLAPVTADEPIFPAEEALRPMLLSLTPDERFPLRNKQFIKGE